ncbi:unnamed protein product [Parnassius mnemosyne]|uniref:Centriolar and ciliogenesis-associated protein HYLS1 C-terminal domain-containing protein n=1 Tax=Parnassius mnemosyne TaxID=213953 RepID=A0AAV1M4I2_9NEOP
MDNDDYYEITTQLDPREILRYLNNLGIQNISGEVLKYFITDLKKFIKYDLQHKKENLNLKKTYELGPERLHSASTFSSRTRSRGAPYSEICSKEYPKTKTMFNFRNTCSAPTIAIPKLEVEVPKRACSCIRIENKPATISKEPKTTSSLNNNLIKVPKQPLKRKNDPVSLYHYYTSLWAKYKPNVPGENNWSELRWSIRQKMAGSIPCPSSKAVAMTNKEEMKSKKL